MRRDALQQWGAAAAPSSMTLRRECVIRETERKRASLCHRSIEWDDGQRLARHGKFTGVLLVADDGVELDDGLLLLRGEGPALDVRPEVVGPPQPAALAAPVQPCIRLRSQNKHH